MKFQRVGFVCQNIYLEIAKEKCTRGWRAIISLSCSFKQWTMNQSKNIKCVTGFELIKLNSGKDLCDCHRQQSVWYIKHVFKLYLVKTGIKYDNLLYNFVKKCPNNSQNEYKYTAIFGQLVICTLPVDKSIF